MCPSAVPRAVDVRRRLWQPRRAWIPAIFMPLRYNVVGLAHIACANDPPHAPLWCARAVAQHACFDIRRPSKHEAAA
ncbi:conserved hypothetical protein [Paraburkholderia caribensis]|nr:conserved hypothetical protein [Paraburkholderia caribensis]